MKILLTCSKARETEAQGAELVCTNLCHWLVEEAVPYAGCCWDTNFSHCCLKDFDIGSNYNVVHCLQNML